MALTTVKNSGLSGSIDLTSKVTGALPVGNGGTGITSGTSGQYLKFTGSTSTASAAVDAGKILQVQHANFITGGTVNTSTSFATTYKTDQITPAATSSKILIQMQCRFYPYRDGTDANNAVGRIAIYRDIGSAGFSKVWPPSGGGDIAIGVSAASIGGDNPAWMDVNFLQPVFFVDSPNTTSACDYTLYIAKVGTMDNMQVGNSSFPADVTLMEIGA